MSKICQTTKAQESPIGPSFLRSILVQCKQEPNAIRPKRETKPWWGAPPPHLHAVAIMMLIHHHPVLLWQRIMKIVVFLLLLRYHCSWLQPRLNVSTSSSTDSEYELSFTNQQLRLTTTESEAGSPHSATCCEDSKEQESPDCSIEMILEVNNSISGISEAIATEIEHLDTVIVDYGVENTMFTAVATAIISPLRGDGIVPSNNISSVDYSVNALSEKTFSRRMAPLDNTVSDHDLAIIGADNPLCRSSSGNSRGSNSSSNNDASSCTPLNPPSSLRDEGTSSSSTVASSTNNLSTDKQCTHCSQGSNSRSSLLFDVLLDQVSNGITEEQCETDTRRRK